MELELESSQPVARRCFCHTCDEEIEAIPTDEELVCTQCHKSFVEELSGFEHANDLLAFIGDRRQATSQATSSVGHEASTPTAGLTPEPQIPQAGASRVDPILLALLGGLSGLGETAGDPGRGEPGRGPAAPSDANIITALLAPPSARSGGGTLGAVGDFGIGEISRLIDELMQIDPSTRGPPPTSAAVIENLEVVSFGGQGQDDCPSECPVCQDPFEAGSTGNRLPCGHCFCVDCIKPWLKEHNTCPVCRFELPTDEN